MKLIDANVAIKGVQDRCLGATSVIVVENRIIDMLNRMPVVDAVPIRHGKWIDITESHIGTCSLCGDRWGSVDMMNYCPSCGARMVEDE